MQFKVKKSTRMEKIFEAYAGEKLVDGWQGGQLMLSVGRKGISAGSLRFLLDGQRIKADDTPKMLELEEGDQIDVVLDQVGGI